MKSKQDRLRKHKKLVEDIKPTLEKQRKSTKKNVEPEKLNFFSPEYGKIKKISLEWTDIYGNKKRTVERLGVKPEFSWPEEWDYKIEQEDGIKKFRAPTPDTFNAYIHFLNQIKPIHNQQFNFGSRRFLMNGH